MSGKQKSGDLVIEWSGDRKGKHKIPPSYVRALPIHAKNGREWVPEEGARPLYGRRDDVAIFVVVEIP